MARTVCRGVELPGNARAAPDSRPVHVALHLLVALAVSGAVACTSSERSAGESAIPQGWPVSREEAVVSSAFGVQRGRSRHEGIDLSAAKGTPVRSTAVGMVSFAGRSGDFGRLVVIDHGDGWQTRYAHLRSIKVRQGAKVRRGEILGTVGKSGNATGYHLHYEIRRHGRAIDPRPHM